MLFISLFAFQFYDPGDNGIKRDGLLTERKYEDQNSQSYNSARHTSSYIIQEYWSLIGSRKQAHIMKGSKWLGGDVVVLRRIGIRCLGCSINLEVMDVISWSNESNEHWDSESELSFYECEDCIAVLVAHFLLIYFIIKQNMLNKNLKFSLFII